MLIAAGIYLLVAAVVYGAAIATAKFEPEFVSQEESARALEWLEAKRSAQQRAA